MLIAHDHHFRLVRKSKDIHDRLRFWRVANMKNSFSAQLRNKGFRCQRPEDPNAIKPMSDKLKTSHIFAHPHSLSHTYNRDVIGCWDDQLI
jgi:hypothetical protein